MYYATVMESDRSSANPPERGRITGSPHQYAAVVAPLGLSVLVAASFAAGLVAGAVAAPAAALAGAGAVAAWVKVKSREGKDAPRATFAKMLERQVENGRRISIQDRSTGLLQKWYFDLRVAEEVSRCKRYGLPMALVRLSASGTKGDTWGSEREWQLGQEVARHMRAVDISTRSGPLEFLVCLPHTDLRGAQRAARRLLTDLEGWSLRASFATHARDGDDADTLIEAALTREGLAREEIPDVAESAESPAIGYLGLIERLAPGESSHLPVAAPDTAKLVKQRLRRAAKRAGVTLRLWDEDGCVCFTLADIAEASAA
jgi:GGDEF domain-containing protein